MLTKLPQLSFANCLRGAALLAIALSVVYPALCADDAAAKQDAANHAELQAKFAEDFVLPEDKSPASLLKFMKQIENTRPDVTEEAQVIAWAKAGRSAILSAADAVLENKETTEDQRNAAIQSKLEAYQLLMRVGDEDAPKKFRELNESLLNSSDPKLAARAKVNVFQFRAQDAAEAEGDEAAAKLLEDVKAFALEDKADIQRIQLVMGVAQILEFGSKTGPALAAYEFLSATYGDSDNKQVAMAISRLADSATKRLRLVGNIMEIEGTTLDGQPFDWSKYKGKVVLVDFWATWCGPCIKELPNVVENYKKYHDKGFEVVGITLDDSKEPVDEFYKANDIPWPTIYDKNAPMAEKYGITAIPAPILVGKDGKVITLNARAEELGQLLEKLLGPAEEGAAQDAEKSQS